MVYYEVRKSDRDYDELFEDLMRYSDFTDARQIKSPQDLNRYFDSIEKDAAKRNHLFITTNKLKRAMARAVARLKRHPQKILHKRAGGHDLGQDQQQTSKNIVKSQKEFRKRGAANVDLKGYDTKKSKKKRSEFK